MKKQFFYILLLSLILGACGKNPEQARRELAKLGISYTSESFEKAVSNEDTVVVDLFLTAGKDPSPVLPDVVLTKDVQLVKKLLDNGADPNYRNGLPLYYAASQGNNEIVKVLLDRAANPDLKALPPWREYASTPLTSASSQGHTETVKLLLNRGANPNDGRKGNSEALLYAIWANHVEIIELLLKSGTNPNSEGKIYVPINTNGRAQTALEVNTVEAARRSLNVELLPLLEQYGVKSR